MESLHGEGYEPTDEERRELEEILSKDEEKREFNKVKVKNRVFFNYNSEDHWTGWLRINGIKW